RHRVRHDPGVRRDHAARRRQPRRARRRHLPGVDHDRGRPVRRDPGAGRLPLPARPRRGARRVHGAGSDAPHRRPAASVNLAPRPIEEPEIGLTPMIDVVFLLLIFFMVSTSFINEASLSLTLPTAATAPAPADAATVEVTVGADGRYFFGANELVNRGRGALREALLDAAGRDTSRTIVVRADARAPHQAVVTVLDVAGGAGFSRVSIVTARD